MQIKWKEAVIGDEKLYPCALFELAEQAYYLYSLECHKQVVGNFLESKIRL